MPRDPLSGFERYPFARFSRAARGRALWVGVAVTLIIGTVMGVLGGPLFTPAAPSGIVSFELAGSAQNAAAMIASWGLAGVALAQKQTWIDFLYIPAYSLTLALSAGLAVWVCARRSRALGWIGVALSWGALAAGLFDVVENCAMLLQWSGSPSDPLAALARVCALVKFTLILAAFTYALIGAAYHMGDGLVRMAMAWMRQTVDKPDGS